VSAVLPSLARLGIGRVTSHFGSASLPPRGREIERVNRSTPRLYRSLRDEFAMLPTTLQQARVRHSLGARPLIVVTATRDAMNGWLPLQDEMVALSTNAVHRTAPYTHDAIIEDQNASQVSVQAIRDVVIAVRTATRLATS
jgi:hypothetical protein